MNLWKRIKNVFTNELVDPLEQVKQLRERGLLLDQASEVVIPNTVEHDWSIDWDRIGTPFSVERTSNDDGVNITTIGYWPPGMVSNEPSEWSLFITDSQHENVVKDFEAWLDLKDEENKTND